MYTYMRRALFEYYGPVSQEIEKSFVEFAICLVESFFRKQKAVMDKVSYTASEFLVHIMTPHLYDVRHYHVYHLKRHP